MTPMKPRIERLYRYSLQHRARVGRFGAIVATFNQELETRIPRVALEGVREWHELIGSTPPSALPPVAEDVRRSVLNAIEQLVSDIESRWGLDA